MDQCYIDKIKCEQIIDKCKKLSIMINNFIEYLKGSGYKGTKYKMPKQKTAKEKLDEMVKQIKAKG